MSFGTLRHHIWRSDESERRQGEEEGVRARSPVNGLIEWANSGNGVSR